MLRAGLVVMMTVCAACAGDDGSSVNCGAIYEPAACKAAAGCQLTGSYCPQSACQDVPASTCSAVTTPRESSGAACSTLDMTACKTRDDCSLVHHIDTGVYNCTAE